MPEHSPQIEPCGEAMLTQVADGVWVRQSAWVWTNSIVVRAEDGLILVDPGIDGSELNQVADDLDRLDIPVVAGFCTHPHWDHLLWHPRFGDVPRYATAAAAHAASEGRERARGWRRRARRASLSSCSGSSPRSRGWRTRAGRDHRTWGARSRPRRGPPRGPWRPARRRHALRCPDPAPRRSPARSGGRYRRHWTGWERPPGTSMSWSPATAPLPRVPR